MALSLGCVFTVPGWARVWGRCSTGRAHDRPYSLVSVGVALSLLCVLCALGAPRSQAGVHGAVPVLPAECPETVWAVSGSFVTLGGGDWGPGTGCLLLPHPGPLVSFSIHL